MTNQPQIERYYISNSCRLTKPDSYAKDSSVTTDLVVASRRPELLRPHGQLSLLGQVKSAAARHQQIVHEKPAGEST